MCTDIMHASYYSACIDEYTVLLTYIYIHAIYLNNLQVIALLEMVCITYQHMVCHACHTCTDIMHLHCKNSHVYITRSKNLHLICVTITHF